LNTLRKAANGSDGDLLSKLIYDPSPPLQVRPHHGLYDT
jgi:hypothetical protein